MQLAHTPLLLGRFRKYTTAKTEGRAGLNHIAIWIISLLSIVGILFRPWKIQEWVFAVSGAGLLLLFQMISLPQVLHAVHEGVDVYFFLIGMMLLSEQARHEGFFDWLAGTAANHAQGSAKRLFILIYGVGILVTAFLSNDATAVVMTPAVYAAVKKAGAKPLPYLFACAFIANAASFLLPISNPANLVVYSSHLPSIFEWVSWFGLPSLLSIAGTFAVLWFWFRTPLRDSLKASHESSPLSLCGKLTGFGLIAVVMVMLTASALEWQLGIPTFVASSFIVIGIGFQKKEWPRKILRDISWSVIPLVAGLFVIVEAVNQVGALSFTHQFLVRLNQYPMWIGKQIAAFSVGIASNLLNNLPVGLIAGMAVHENGIIEGVKNAVLVGVDLGPNLSVTGSLATLLWLMAIRREGEKVSGVEFLKVGLIAMPIALFLAILCL